MKKRAAPDNDEIAAAIDKAVIGHGMPLARLIKSLSLDDLAGGFRGLSRASMGPMSLRGLHIVLCRAAGRKEQRERDAEATRAESARARRSSIQEYVR